MLLEHEEILVSELVGHLLDRMLGGELQISASGFDQISPTSSVWTHPTYVQTNFSQARRRSSLSVLCSGIVSPDGLVLAGCCQLCRRLPSM